MQSRLPFAVIALVASVFVIGSYTNAHQSQEETSTELKDLLTKRRDVLQHLVDTYEKKLSQGRTQVDPVVAAREQLLDAKLQLATSKKQRLEICQKRIDNMWRLETAMKLRSEAGQTTLESLLLARAGRLQAEIDLAREKN